MRELPPTDDPATLMRAANRGDDVAYRRLLEVLIAPLRSVAIRGLARAGRGSGDAEDIVQETLLAVHLKRHTWDERQPLEPWVRAIAHHKLVDALRRRGFRQHVPLEECDDLLSVPPHQADISAAAFTDLLGRLPERQREIVRAISIEGRSAREVGDRLGMTESAVRVALHRALKALAKTLRRGET